MRRPTIRSLAGGAAGMAALICGGLALTSGSAGNPSPAPAVALIDAAHLPPVLTLPGEPVRLRYAIVCAPRDDGRPCEGSGEVYLRSGRSGPFQRLALRRGDYSAEGRYYADVPVAVASSPDGFSYYAVLRDDSTGAEITVPSGGAAAPQRSFRLRNAVGIELGPHSFGRTRPPDAKVVDAPWGSGLGRVGLAGSRELGFTGPSAFDVADDGTVTLLDQVNGRLERWSHGRASATPVEVGPGLADLDVEADGTANVLEPPDRLTPVPTLRRFDRTGKLEWAQRLSDRTWSKLAEGPAGPVVLQEPSEQWLPLAVNGAPLDRPSQSARAKPGNARGRDREVVVERLGTGELRLADLAGERVHRAWRIRSSTPLGEVQLAEAIGDSLVVVAKAYTDDESEYVVLVLGPSGVSQRLALAATEWAEGAPLARFRLAGASLYQLGSTPARAFVDRFDLEVPR
jgi:hypothetical protein